jgi:hypothetical protein
MEADEAGGAGDECRHTGVRIPGEERQRRNSASEMLADIFGALRSLASPACC